MKSLPRSLIVNGVVFWLLAKFTPALVVENTRSLVLVVLALTLVNLTIKPVLKLITLPLNILTLGLFSWAYTLVALYLAILAIPGVYITGFVLPGFSGMGFTIPTVSFSRLATLAALSIVLSLAERVVKHTL